MDNKKRAQILIDLGDDDEAFEIKRNLEEYRDLTGNSMKWLYLTSLAGIIYRENPLLGERIVKFATRRRKTGRG
jgi:hypothetical protein